MTVRFIEVEDLLNDWHYVMSLPTQVTDII